MKSKLIKQECIPVGCVPAACRPYLGGGWSWGVYLVPGGVPGRGGVHLVAGVYLALGGVPHTPPLWTEFLTHACENITLAQIRCGR